ncbi:MAG: hypothetical protein EXR67_01255 [Dehalococcoidia bacterium]|nr:hypothetical protein [Dehalococcoidia bacterium]
MATDDVLGSTREEKFIQPSTMPVQARNRNLPAGVYRAAMPNGKSIALLRVMFTDFCMMDCAYCPNSHWVPRKRFSYTIEELSSLFMELYQRQTVAGLFLSSGIAGSPDKIMTKETRRLPCAPCVASRQTYVQDALTNFDKVFLNQPCELRTRRLVGAVNVLGKAKRNSKNSPEG